MKLLLCHDDLSLRWTPFVETRPVGELLYGTLLLRERAERALGVASTGYVGAAHLEGFDEPGAPPHVQHVNDGEEDRILLSVRAALDGPPQELPSQPATLYVEGQVAGWIVPAGAGAPSPERISGLQPGDGARLDLPGRLLERPWHLMAGNPERIAADVARHARHNDAFQLTDVHVVGDRAVLLGDHAVVEPGVVLDTRAGPIWLDRNARIEGPARVSGPFYLGPDSIVLGGAVGTSSIGPACVIRGEVVNSVILGYSNKRHDGHLGHAVLGRWVNLGADTSNSDLKNTYSSVRVRLPEGDVDTGLLKCGAFLGDHVRTGIGTLLNTGTVIGAATSIHGQAMPLASVPPFSWGEGDKLVEHRLERFLRTAAAAADRRGVQLSSGIRQVLTRAAERARAARDREANPR